MNSSSSSMGGDGRHDDDAALTEFLASLMDYTPTVKIPNSFGSLYADYFD